ncbi:hypothetical protein [Sinorhizobium fredii]|uniref:hypothetical protein n=1 Tax=Rhizobium fredii TaxID=380 RepID=UPI00030BA65F|nr:hypothetical protein [Sinorhizobium fredii]
MRIFAMAVAITALAVAPCAWDTAPPEPPAIGALFGGPMASPDEGPALATPRPVTPIAVDAVLK